MNTINRKSIYAVVAVVAIVAVYLLAFKVANLTPISAAASGSSLFPFWLSSPPLLSSSPCWAFGRSA